MNKLTSAIVSILMALAILAVPGCAASTPGASAQSLKDAAGRSVTLESTPMRIVSLAPSDTEMLFALGIGDRVVADTEYCDYPPAAKSLPKIGGFQDVDVERVVALHPDLVVAANLHVADTVPALEKLGLTVFVSDPKTVDQILTSMTALGKLTGTQKQAEEATSKLRARLAEVEAKVAKAQSKPRVFWMLGEGHTLFTAGPGSYANDIITRAGGANVAADTGVEWPQISLEAVVQADPEVIIIPGKQGQAIATKLRADPIWQQTSAVKNNRFVFVEDENLVNRPGPRVVEGIEIVARGLHPDQLK